MTSQYLKQSIKQKRAANKIIRRQMLIAAGLGLIPFPLIDAITILSTQMWMIRDIANVYNLPFQQHRVKSFISSLVGSLGAISAVKAIPVVGTVLGGVSVSIGGAAATYAIGKVFTQHFDQGGTLLDFNPVESRKYFHELYEEGKQEAAQLKANKSPRFTRSKSPETATTETTTSTTRPKKYTAAESAKQSRKARHLALAKRREALEAKKRKNRRKIWLERIVFFIIIGCLAWFLYFQANFKPTPASTNLDLFLQEQEAIQVDLKPAQELDSLTIAKIAAFSPNSTEGVISKYIQNKDATYPKRYFLSAVRFQGNSNVLNSGAQEQLSNIAFLMKKYPDLTVNLYGHTTNIGPTFSRKKVGRERARKLKSAFLDLGIPSYRITGNYIEKSDGTHNEYWGAEIVLDVTTEESVVEVVRPKTKEKKSRFIPGFLRKPFKEEPTEPIEIGPITEPLENNTTTTVENEAEILPKDTLEEVPTIDSTAQEIQPLDPEAAEEEEEPIIQAATSEELMTEYLKVTNSKYPKLFPLGQVVFKGESTNLNKRAKKQLANIAQLIKKYPTMEITIYGHASDGGKKKKEQLKWQNIGLERAQAIKAILHKNGISNSKMAVKVRLHKGESKDKQWGAEIGIDKK